MICRMLLVQFELDTDWDFFLVQDVSQDDIPIMLVGNKTDLRKEALMDGVTCIPTSYGEKLAMVSAQALFIVI